MSDPLELFVNIETKPITDQIAAYERLQTQLEATSIQDQAVLDELFELQSMLKIADRSAQVDYACQDAGNLFLSAFRIDPHNQQLYWLADLMHAMEKIGRSQSDEWETECARLQSQPEYDFVAARTYLEKARTRITGPVLETLQLIRTGLIDSASANIETVVQTWTQPPVAFQCLEKIIEAYWHLYDYGRKNLGVTARLQNAEMALGDAKIIFAKRPTYNELSEELSILDTLIKTYGALSQTKTHQFESLKAYLEPVSNRPDHAFVKRIYTELDSLSQWRGHYETVLSNCEAFQYDKAAEYLSHLTDLDKAALGWLVSIKLPDVEAWLTFTDQAKQALSFWHAHQYAESQMQFSAALSNLPTYLDGQQPQTIYQHLTSIVQDLDALRICFEENLSLLNNATDYDGYRQVAQKLGVAQAIEDKYQPKFNSEPYLADVISRANQFVTHGQAGELLDLRRLVSEAQETNDPLQAGYVRITELIDGGMNPTVLDTALDYIGTAIRLAPNSQALKDRQKTVSALIQSVNQILDDIYNGRLAAAWDSLEKWESAQSNLPPAINVLWHICAGYDCLAGPAGRDFSTQKRLDQSIRSLNEAKRVHGSDGLARVTQELFTLNKLVEVYQGLYQQGFASLQSGINSLQTIADTPGAKTSHAFVRKAANDLTHLNRWQRKHDRFFSSLTHFRYAQAAQDLNEISDDERRALEWMQNVSQPDWAAWEAFCIEAERGLNMVQSKDHRQARTQFALAMRKIPADFPVDQTRVIQGQLNSLVRDLVTVETRLTDSRRGLEQALDARVYNEVTANLEEASKIEGKYFQADPTEASSIAAMTRRFARFQAGARSGDMAEIQTVLDEAKDAQDLLVPGYSAVIQTIERGAMQDATHAEVAAAWKLAPDSEGLDSRIDLIETTDVVNIILQSVRSGQMDKAGRMLDKAKQERPHSQQIQCTAHIFDAYQYLQPDPNASQTTYERLGHAQKTLDEPARCLGPALTQEQEIVRNVVNAYANFHPEKRAELSRSLAELQEAKRGLASHTFVQQLDEDIGGLNKLLERRQQILDDWMRRRYHDAWQMMDDLTETEARATSRFDKQTAAAWQQWREFGETMQRCMTDWQHNDYSGARAWLDTAKTRLPADIDQSTQRVMAGHIDELVADLDIMQHTIENARVLLEEHDAENFDAISETLVAAQGIEQKYSGKTNGDLDQVASIGQRFAEFKQNALIGNTDQMARIIHDSTANKDPLSDTYREIRGMIVNAKRQDASRKAVQNGLKLAPQDPQLAAAGKKLKRFGGFFWMIIALLAASAIGGIAYIAAL